MRYINNIGYFFRRKYQQINNLIKWFPIIWEIRDFDYHYAIVVFKFQLKNIADFLESDKAYSLSGKQDAKRIRTTIELMDKVYDDYYGTEYQDKIKEKYGDYRWEFNPTEVGEYFTMKKCWDRKYTPEQINEIESEEHKLFLESHQKQEKAHSLLWKYVSHNIRRWWD
jgi:hypothetical protein